MSVRMMFRVPSPRTGLRNHRDAGHRKRMRSRRLQPEFPLLSLGLKDSTQKNTSAPQEASDMDKVGNAVRDDISVAELLMSMRRAIRNGRLDRKLWYSFSGRANAAWRAGLFKKPSTLARVIKAFADARIPAKRCSLYRLTTASVLQSYRRTSLHARDVILILYYARCFARVGHFNLDFFLELIPAQIQHNLHNISVAMALDAIVLCEQCVTSLAIALIRYDELAAGDNVSSAHPVIGHNQSSNPNVREEHYDNVFAMVQSIDAFVSTVGLPADVMVSADKVVATLQSIQALEKRREAPTEEDCVRPMNIAPKLDYLLWTSLPRRIVDLSLLSQCKLASMLANKGHAVKLRVAHLDARKHQRNRIFMDIAQKLGESMSSDINRSKDKCGVPRISGVHATTAQHLSASGFWKRHLFFDLVEGLLSCIYLHGRSSVDPVSARRWLDCSERLKIRDKAFEKVMRTLGHMPAGCSVHLD